MASVTRASGARSTAASSSRAASSSSTPRLAGSPWSQREKPARQRRLEAFAVEHELERVEQEPRRRIAPVLRVAGDGRALVRQLHAKLMRLARFGPELDERPSPGSFAERRDGARFGAPLADDARRAALGDESVRERHGSALEPARELIRTKRDGRDVASLEAMLFDRAGNARVSLARRRERDDPARPEVEPLVNADVPFVSALAEPLREPRHEISAERLVPAVHRDPGRLVDDEQPARVTDHARIAKRDEQAGESHEIGFGRELAETIWAFWIPGVGCKRSGFQRTARGSRRRTSPRGVSSTRTNPARRQPTRPSHVFDSATTTQCAIAP